MAAAAAPAAAGAAAGAATGLSKGFTAAGAEPSGRAALRAAAGPRLRQRERPKLCRLPRSRGSQRHGTRRRCCCLETRRRHRRPRLRLRCLRGACWTCLPPRRAGAGNRSSLSGSARSPCTASSTKTRWRTSAPRSRPLTRPSSPTMPGSCARSARPTRSPRQQHQEQHQQQQHEEQRQPPRSRQGRMRRALVEANHRRSRLVPAARASAAQQVTRSIAKSKNPFLYIAAGRAAATTTRTWA